MGQLPLPSTTFPRPPGLPGPLPFSFSLLGHHGTTNPFRSPCTRDDRGGDIPLSSRRTASHLFLNEPSSPAMVGPASLMLMKMQIPHRSQGVSKSWLWRGKPSSPPRQGERGRILHPPPQHDVGMVTPCPSCSIMGGTRPVQTHASLPGASKKAAGARPPSHPQIPNLAPCHPSCPSLPHVPTSTGRGFCRKAVAPARPCQWPSPSRPLPLPQLLLARVSSPVFGSGTSWTLLKSFLCACACVCECVLIT